MVLLTSKTILEVLTQLFYCNSGRKEGYFFMFIFNESTAAAIARALGAKLVISCALLGLFLEAAAAAH